jgi:hypothetical protein
MNLSPVLSPHKASLAASDPFAGLPDLIGGKL